MSRTVLVTGITSFLGYHLGIGFKQAGYSVVGTGLSPRSDYAGIRRQRLDDLGGNILFERMDLRDIATVENVLNAHRPALWIHHAGFATGYASLDYDVATGRAVNVTPLESIYPLLGEYGCKGVILTGSSMEYSDTHGACHEDDQCSPVTPYGSIKLEQTLAALRLSAKHGIPTRVARVFIPFGTFDDPERVVPLVMGALRNKMPSGLSSGQQQRDFLHVDDLVAGYIHLANDLDRGGAQIFNVCSGVPLRLRDFFLEIANIQGAPPDLLRFGTLPMRAGEPLISYGNTDRLTALGWQAADLSVSLNKYIAEFK